MQWEVHSRVKHETVNVVRLPVDFLSLTAATWGLDSGCGYHADEGRDVAVPWICLGLHHTSRGSWCTSWNLVAILSAGSQFNM